MLSARKIVNLYFEIALYQSGWLMDFFQNQNKDGAAIFAMEGFEKRYPYSSANQNLYDGFLETESIVGNINNESL
jgi:hypothetical protein